MQSGINSRLDLNLAKSYRIICHLQLHTFKVIKCYKNSILKWRKFESQCILISATRVHSFTHLFMNSFSSQ